MKAFSSTSFITSSVDSGLSLWKDDGLRLKVVKGKHLVDLNIVNTDQEFSCSLIIHQLKTKKITTVKEVWMPGLNWTIFVQFYLSGFTLVFVSIEKIYRTLETEFHPLSKHFKFRQKYFSSRCLEIPMKHGLVFDILHRNPQIKTPSSLEYFLPFNILSHSSLST